MPTPQEQKFRSARSQVGIDTPSLSSTAFEGEVDAGRSILNNRASTAAVDLQLLGPEVASGLDLLMPKKGMSCITGPVSQLAASQGIAAGTVLLLFKTRLQAPHKPLVESRFFGPVMAPPANRFQPGA